MNMVNTYKCSLYLTFTNMEHMDGKERIILLDWLTSTAVDTAVEFYK